MQALREKYKPKKFSEMVGIERFHKQLEVITTNKLIRPIIITGGNGTGKTTLFKVISGIYGYDSGDIYTSKDCEIGYLEQNTNFNSNNTILEEVLEVFKDLGIAFLGVIVIIYILIVLWF